MGAWIETPTVPPQFGNLVVAPFMGAWIETGATVLSRSKVRVAPFMGAWIETSNVASRMTTRSGRTLHGCVD